MQVEIAENVGQLSMMSDNVISIQNINLVNLTSNVVILQLLINIVCTNVDITIVNNDIRVVVVVINLAIVESGGIIHGKIDNDDVKSHVQRGLLATLPYCG